MMLWYICLAVVMASAASKVLRYKDNIAVGYDHDGTAKMMRDDRIQDDGVTKEPVVAPCKVNHTSVNCSHLGITSLEQLPDLTSSITELDLSFNSIKNIPSFSLKKFYQLLCLNFSNNLIQKLDDDSFFNLTALLMLDLSSNNLTMDNETYPPGVFVPLASLTHLWINKNTKETAKTTSLAYPDEALGQLNKTLKYLFMDGLPFQVFGLGLSSLASLTNLTIQGMPWGYCSMPSLPAEMFGNLSSVQNLVLRNCSINGSLMHPEIFIRLVNLSSLDIGHNDDLFFEPLGYALNMIKNNSNFKSLIMNNLNNPYSPGLCVRREFAASLPRGLEFLDISSNSIETVEDGVLASLPKSLRSLNINDNRFVFGSYLQDLDKLENLHFLEISEWNTFRLPWYYPPEIPEAVRCCNVSNSSKAVRKEQLIQALPPKLKKIIITNAGWSNYLTGIQFNPNNSLADVTMDWNNFPSLIGPIIGLNELKNLSMAGCNIKYIDPKFFQNFPKLKYLNLSSNYFGPSVFDKQSSPFQNLSCLTDLDLSFCVVENVPYNAFEGSKNLQILMLQRNQLGNFSADLSNMMNLTYINLSLTQLSSLSRTVRDTLDNISHYSNLIVDFQVDSINCYCSNLDFLQWMTKTKVLKKTDNYTCSFVENYKKAIDDFAEMYVHLNRACTDHFQLFSVVITCTCLLILAISGFIAYRFRWELRYLYYFARMYFEKKPIPNKNFEYDVFISYAHEDHNFVVESLYPQLSSRGLRVHIHGLHFIAGDFISANIVNAVHNCKRTLVVLTPNLMNSKWGEYEVEMANMEQIHSRRSVLLFLIKGALTKVSRQFLYHIKSNTYIKFPEPQDDYQAKQIMEMFWKKLVSDLQK